MAAMQLAVFTLALVLPSPALSIEDSSPQTRQNNKRELQPSPSPDPMYGGSPSDSMYGGASSGSAYGGGSSYQSGYGSSSYQYGGSSSYQYGGSSGYIDPFASPSPSPPLPPDNPRPLAPPGPPATPGSRYATTVSFSLSCDTCYENNIETIEQVEDRYPGGTANFTHAYVVALEKQYPNASSVAVVVNVPDITPPSSSYGGSSSSYSGSSSNYGSNSYGGNSYGGSYYGRKRALASENRAPGSEQGGGGALKKKSHQKRELKRKLWGYQPTLTLNVKMTFPSLNDANSAADTLRESGVSDVSVLENELLPGPAPPPPPFPPYTLNVCKNTCSVKSEWGYTDYYARNGNCEESAPSWNNADGAYTGDPLCSFGTDCADCGPREVCTEGPGCPESCRVRAWRDGLKGKSFCASKMLGDGKCDVECNNWECGHDNGDCNLETEAKPKCITEQREAELSARLSLHPGKHDEATQRTTGSTNASALVEAELRVTFFPMFTMSETNGLWRITVANMQLSLRWRDSRLARAPCKALYPSMMTFDPGSENDAEDGRALMTSYKEMIWFPRVEFEEVQLDDYTVGADKTKKTISAARFDYVEGANPWASNSTPSDGAQVCVDCAQFDMTTTTSFAASSLTTFGMYPFDQQKFVFRFRVVGAHIFTCNKEAFLPPGVTAKDLLPTTGEWVVNGDVTVELQTAQHADGTSFIDQSTCALTIPVQRNFVMFVIKQVVMSIIIVYAGLAALYMSAADHTGDRAGLIGVSALIIMVNFQTTLVIGEQPYLVWWDVFNLFAFAVLSISLIISLIEHVYLTTGGEEFALTLNKVSRIGLLLGIYPSILLFLLIAGLDGNWSAPGALAVLICGIFVTLIIMVWKFKREMRAGKTNRQSLVDQLRNTPVNSPSFHSILEESFYAFDLDNSGFLDIGEIRDLFHILYYEKLGPPDFAKAMLEARRFADHKGEFNVDAVIDAMVHLSTLWRLAVPEPKVPATLMDVASVATKSSTTNSWLKQLKGMQAARKIAAVEG